jgi:hypothetical protein
VAVASLSGIGVRGGTAKISLISIPEDGGTVVEDDMLPTLPALGDFVRARTGEASLSM